MSLSIQSSNPSSYNSQPLSSTLIQSLGDKAKQIVVPSQQDPNLITPEDVNRAVRSAEVSLSEASQQQQAQADAKRSALVDVNGAQHQQEMLDIYLQVASDGEYSGGSSDSASAALDIFDKDQLEPIQPRPKDDANIQSAPAALASYSAVQANSQQHMLG